MVGKAAASVFHFLVYKSTSIALLLYFFTFYVVCDSFLQDYNYFIFYATIIILERRTAKPLPPRGCIYTAAASQGCPSHLLQRPRRLRCLNSSICTLKPLYWRPCSGVQKRICVCCEFFNKSFFTVTVSIPLIKRSSLE